MNVWINKKAREHIFTIKRYPIHRWGLMSRKFMPSRWPVTMADIPDYQPSPGRDRREDLVLPH